MRSASSRTSACTRSRRRCFCLARSSRRPGVPTRISTPLAQRVDLRLVGHAAVDRQDAHAAGAAGRGEVLGDLEAELAGGYDDQRLRHAVGALGGREDALEQRDAEAERLAGAGRRLADQVGAAHRDRQRVLLDGERAGDAGGGERLDGLGAGAELGEGGCCRVVRVRSRPSASPAASSIKITHGVVGVPSRGAPRLSVGRDIGLARATRDMSRGPHARRGKARLCHQAYPIRRLCHVWCASQGYAECGVGYPLGHAGVACGRARSSDGTRAAAAPWSTCSACSRTASCPPSTGWRPTPASPLTCADGPR